jgi:hypothetical protein
MFLAIIISNLNKCMHGQGQGQGQEEGQGQWQGQGQGQVQGFFQAVCGAQGCRIWFPQARNCMICVPRCLNYVYILPLDLSTPSISSCVPLLVRYCTITEV